MFLYIDPLKQGLKQDYLKTKDLVLIVFIHRSIKTRIETQLKLAKSGVQERFYT